MKNLSLHIGFSVLWIMILSFFFTNGLMASVQKDSSHFSKSCYLQKIVSFSLDGNPLSQTNDMPENSSSENHEISGNDVEDSGSSFDINLIALYTTYKTFYNKLTIVIHKQYGKLQHNVDIVPPPPKF